MQPWRTPSVVLKQSPVRSLNKTALSFSLLYRVFIFDSEIKMKTEHRHPSKTLKIPSIFFMYFKHVCTLLLFDIDLLNILLVRLTEL